MFHSQREFKTDHVADTERGQLFWLSHKSMQSYARVLTKLSSQTFLFWKCDELYDTMIEKVKQR